MHGRRGASFPAFLLILGNLLLFARTAFGAPEVLSREAYVWQRDWTPALVQSLGAHGHGFDQLVILAAEVSWRPGQPKVVRVSIDYAALRNVRTRIGLALRIGPATASAARDPNAAVFLVRLATSLLSEAEARGLGVAELQLDFDCAESKLHDYQLWVEAIRASVARAGVPLCITALPSWLRQPAFSDLARAAGSYILQVHSLERPVGVEARFILCDPASARNAVERAAALGIPFRVALPTYGYRVAFDSAGRFIGLSAEGPPPSGPKVAQVREVRADPTELCGLVQQWSRDHPSALRGLIWYRFPSPSDSLNWSWETLSAVMAGRCPRAEVLARATMKEPTLAEITLVNLGEADYVLDSSLVADWPTGRLLAADAVHGFELATTARHRVEFSVATNRPPLRLAPGQECAVGWLRLATNQEVKVEIRNWH